MKTRLTALALLTATVINAAVLSDISFSLNESGTAYTVTACSVTASGSLEVPGTYNGLPVTSIGEGAFMDCTSLTSVTLQNSITSIGRDAFRNCESLGGFIIPSSVTTIAANAFRNCSSLINFFFIGAAPTTDKSAFKNTVRDAVAIVPALALASFGGEGASWNNLIVITVSDSIYTKSQYDAVVAERDALPTQAEYDAVVAQHDALPTQAEYDAVVAQRDALPTQAEYDAVVAQRNRLPTRVEYEAVVAERDARPTLAAFETVCAERDAKLTLEEVRDLRAGSSMFEVANGVAGITLKIEETSELSDWSNAATSEATLQVEVPTGQNARFYRVKVKE